MDPITPQEPRHSPTFPWTELAKILGLALAYFVTGKLGTLLAIPPGYATAIWAPSGIALAGILIYGYRVWPGIWLGSCLVNFSTTLQAVHSNFLFISLAVVASIGMGASLEAVVGAFLIRRIVGFPNSLDRERDVFRFLALGGPISCIVNATIGTTTLLLSGAIPSTNYWSNWGTWWIGDSIGVLVLTPLLLILFTRPLLTDSTWSRRRILVALPLCLTFLMVIVLFIFSSVREQTQTKLEFQRRANTLSHALKLRLESDAGVLAATGSFMQSASKIEESTFHKFSLGFFLRYPDMESLLWIPRPPVDDRFTAPRFVEPHEGNKSLLRFDFGKNPSSLNALKKARDSGTLAATDRIAFTQEVPPRTGIFVFLPVYPKGEERSITADRRKNVQGFVGAFLKIDALVESAFKGLDQEGIDISIEDQSAPPEHRVLFSRISAAQKETRLQSGSKNPRLAVGVEWETPTHVAGRQWLLRFSETQEYLIAHRNWHAWLVLLTGLLFTALLGAYLLIMTGRTSRVEALVARRTASLEASEAKFRSVMQSAQDAIVTFDTQGNILSWNRAAQKTFGYSESEVLGTALSLILPALSKTSDDRVDLADLVGKTIELTGLKKNGTELPLEISFARWGIEKEDFFSAFLRDVTERKKIDQMKTDFVSFASHQLKTPLAEIEGFVENMLTGIVGSFTPKQLECLQFIKNSSQKSRRLVSDLLSVSKMEQGMIKADSKPVALEELVRSTLVHFREVIDRKGLQLILNTPDDKILVLADAGKAVEAISNVLDNAVKFTDAGSIELKMRLYAHRATLEITDTGLGIKPALLSRLFSKELMLADSTNVRGGSGLGLYIAKSFMRLQGGDLTAESTPGQGSRFTFTFGSAGN